MRKRIIFLLLLATLVALFLIAGCFGKKPAPSAPPAKPRPARVQPRPADPKAQQFYYDQGLKYYSDEDYPAAEKAFQRAIDSGADTPLATKARENLAKTRRVLKTLDEMEKQ